MAITATKIYPNLGEPMPTNDGRLEELWSVRHDGSSVEVTINADSIRFIEAASCGEAVNNLTALAGRTVTFTFSIARADGETQTARITGRL